MSSVSRTSPACVSRWVLKRTFIRPAVMRRSSSLAADSISGTAASMLIAGAKRLAQFFVDALLVGQLFTRGEFVSAIFGERVERAQSLAGRPQFFGRYA